MILTSNIVFCVVFIATCGFCDLQCNSNGTNSMKLVIDHDGGADDAMGIFLALLHEKYFSGPKVVGIMTNHGNVFEEQAFINTQRILDVANRRDIPIFRGANRSLIAEVPSDWFFGKDGLGETSLYNTFEPLDAEPEHASVALLRLSQEFEGDLTVLSLGALTNIALAILMDPEFIRRLDKMTIAAGNLNSKEFPDPDFNAHMDVEAYAVVAKNSIPSIVTMVPFSQCCFNITKDWRLSILGSLDTKIMKAQNAFEAFSMKNFATHTWVRPDPVAAAITLDRSLVQEAYYAHNNVILCGENRGINTNMFEASDCNMEVLKTVDEIAYKKFLQDVFSSEMFCDLN